MTTADVAEILKLSADERLRLVELLWDSLSEHPSDLPLSEAHQAAIDAELAEHAANPKDVLTLEQVLAEVRKR